MQDHKLLISEDKLIQKVNSIFRKYSPFASGSSLADRIINVPSVVFIIFTTVCWLPVLRDLAYIFKLPFTTFVSLYGYNLIEPLFLTLATFLFLHRYLISWFLFVGYFGFRTFNSLEYLVAVDNKDPMNFLIEMFSISRTGAISGIVLFGLLLMYLYLLPVRAAFKIDGNYKALSYVLLGLIILFHLYGLNC